MRNLGNNIVGSSLLLKAAYLLMLFSVSGLEAQSVPADLLDLSIEELFKAEISDHSAPVTNPSLFGGEQAEVVVGFKFPLFSSSRYFEIEFGKPFYQHLNGPQSGEEFRFGLQFCMAY